MIRFAQTLPFRDWCWYLINLIANVTLINLKFHTRKLIAMCQISSQWKLWHWKNWYQTFGTNYLWFANPHKQWKWHSLKKSNGLTLLTDWLKHQTWKIIANNFKFGFLVLDKFQNLGKKILKEEIHVYRLRNMHQCNEKQILIICWWSNGLGWILT